MPLLFSQHPCFLPHPRATTFHGAELETDSTGYHNINWLVDSGSSAPRIQSRISSADITVCCDPNVDQ